MITVKKIKAEDTYFLRKQILRKNIDLPHQFEGDFSEDTFHLGVFENDELQTIGTFMKVDLKELKGKHYQLRGMATSEKGRGKGFGKLLLKFATNQLEELKIDFLWCNAREIALKFYEKNDFKIMGERFTNKAGPHFKMYKSITK
ncbi:GNAT family N-acetyltransferase [Tenacibaculum jejuense]|uniref:Acetyltransferase, GNAT family protein n=1 Tax=Tenacibaculum jejuense TaxID=584609 RepID=A0A238UDC1_9FLAO|nr:GNAT family N-acetyltransferase [Tenacibaculum jejuense]SNR16484.1 Acetyltransferase, GNAT family protein [Tenacibaculum jejuense]